MPFSVLGQGGFVMDCEVLPALRTGASWRARLGPWRFAGDGLAPVWNEDLDARDLPEHWRAASFDDGDWAPAVVLAGGAGWGESDGRPPGAPFTLLEPSPLPPQLETSRQPQAGPTLPVDILAGRSGVFDLGQTVAVLEVEVVGEAGTMVDLTGGGDSWTRRPG